MIIACIACKGSCRETGNELPLLAPGGANSAPQIPTSLFPFSQPGTPPSAAIDTPPSHHITVRIPHVLAMSNSASETSEFEFIETPAAPSSNLPAEDFGVRTTAVS
jgi:hypothetical protein